MLGILGGPVGNDSAFARAAYLEWDLSTNQKLSDPGLELIKINDPGQSFEDRFLDARGAVPGCKKELRRVVLNLL